MVSSLQCMSEKKMPDTGCRFPIAFLGEHEERQRVKDARYAFVLLATAASVAVGHSSHAIG